MSADNVLLFMLVWTFMAVCRAYEFDSCHVSCDDVTGSVGKELTFTCSTSWQCKECCISVYKFQSPYVYDDLAICKQEPIDTFCEQRDNFICRYTPTTEMTERFKFFIQTMCGSKKTEFTVDVTGPFKPNIDTEAPANKGMGTILVVIIILSPFIGIIFSVGMAVFCKNVLQKRNCR